MLRRSALCLVPLLIAAAACSSSEPSRQDVAALGPSDSMFTLPTVGNESANQDPEAPPANAAPEASAPAGEGSPSGEGVPSVGGLTPPPAPPPDGSNAGTTPPPAPEMTAMQPPAAMEPPAAMQPPPPATSFPPSAGCGRANPARGAGALTIRGAQADYFVTLPPNYDPNVPTPLIFGFHGRNRTHTDFRTVDASGIETDLGSRAVMAYLKSQGGPGWNFAAEVPPSVEFFEALYPQMLANYCIDTAQIFLVGHSSGAYFSEILACRFGERFRGIGAVAGEQQEKNCSAGRVAALLVHGTMDAVVSFAGGMDARNFYLDRNGCDDASQPGAVAPCVAYQNCEAGLPVQWCQHTEPTYTDQNTGRPTNHGWPSFATRAISQFFFSLPPRSE